MKKSEFEVTFKSMSVMAKTVEEAKEKAIEEVINGNLEIEDVEPY